MNHVHRLNNHHSQSLLMNRQVNAQTKNVQTEKSQNAALMTDASEELTFQFSASMEKKMKSLSNRSFSRVNQQKRIECIEKLRELYGMLDSELTQENLEQQASLMYNQLLNDQDADFSNSSNPAADYIVLREVLDLARNNNCQSAVHTINQQIDQLYERNGQQVDAGLNTAETIANNYQGNEQRESMREVYYRNILGTASSNDMLNSLLDMFGDDNFEKSVDVLTQALLHDMKSSRPSSDESFLKIKLKDLDSVNGARSLVNDCKAVLYALEKSVEEIHSTPTALAKDMLNTVKGTIFPNDLNRMAENVVGYDLTEKLVFYNKTNKLVEELPIGAWGNEKNRQQGIGTLRAHMEQQANLESQQLG